MPLDMERRTCGSCGEAIYRAGPGSPWLKVYVKAGDTDSTICTGSQQPHVPCPKDHKPGEHDKSCVPPADPHSPELRLIRAIYGLCPLCDRTDEHDHPEGHPVRVVIDYGLPGYGPDASNDSFSICETWPDVADELRRRLDESAEGVLQHAEALAEQGDYEAAWKTRKHADEMWLLYDNLDNNRRNAPLYKDDPVGWAMTIETIAGANFPYDVDSGCRIYCWEDAEFGADEDEGYDPVLDPADGAHTAAAYEAELARGDM